MNSNINHINNLINHILTNNIEVTTTNKKHTELYREVPFFIEKPISDVNHKKTDSLFTKAYLEHLSSVLGKASDFKKCTPIERKRIQADIAHLSKNDTGLKNLLHKAHETKSTYPSILPAECRQFNELVTLFYSSCLSTLRGTENMFHTKYRKMFNEILSFIKKEGFLTDLGDMNNAQAYEIFYNQIKVDTIFDIFCTILLKKASETMLKEANATILFNETALSIVRHTFIYDIYKQLTIDLFIQTVVIYVQMCEIVLPLDATVTAIKNVLLVKYSFVINGTNVLAFNDAINTLFDFYAECGVFSDTIHEQMGDQTIIKYSFNPTLSQHIGNPSLLPSIITPKKVNNKNLRRHIITNSFGSMTITAGRPLLDSLNISNRKRFRINENYLRLLLLIENAPTLAIKRPVPSAGDIAVQKFHVEQLNTAVASKMSFKTMGLLFNVITQDKIDIKCQEHLKQACGITKAESIFASTKKRAVDLKQNMSISRTVGLSRIIIAQIMSGFPIYYTNYLCATTRAFAQEHLISRHIGCLKQLRAEFTSTRKTIKGLIYMLEAYYSKNTSILIKLRLLIQKRVNRKTLSDFFFENKIDYSQREEVTSFALLSLEIQNVLLNNKSGYMLQIDQVASGMVLLSLLFNNKKLAQKTNVLPNNDTLGLYEYVMSQFESFYDANIKKRNNKVLAFFKTDRKITKLALMCYAYRQTHFGRSQNFVSRWNNLYGKAPDSSEWATLNEISLKFETFINELFPGLHEQISVLDKIIEFVVKNTGKIAIRTIDSEIIEWQFHKMEKKTRKSIKPITFESISYVLQKPVITQRNNIDEIEQDISKFKTKFLSYLVHSLDAGIMRKAIVLMHKRHNYKMDQLFDCFLVCPNNVDHLFDVLNEIYSDGSLLVYMNDHVFGHIRTTLSGTAVREFNELVKRFNACNHINNKLVNTNIDIKRMYGFEVS